VEKNGSDATGVDYSRLTVLLIEAVKQQQREIRQQKALLRTRGATLRTLRVHVRAMSVDSGNRGPVRSGPNPAACGTITEAVVL